MKNGTAIDIVYLWVDGNDPSWRRKRHLASLQQGVGRPHDLALYGNVEGRFRDNDELRYSLRSLERYFPDHGHIYIVTDDQCPAWLCPSERLTVIDHRDLIPVDCLPTFDSANIESYIHRIPGLSERYFYLNDDVFFGAPVKISDWFWAGGIYAAWSDEPEVTDGPLHPDAGPLDNACRMSHQWLSARYADPRYQPIFRTFAHSPRPMLKSLLFDLERLAPNLFDRVRSTVFRAWDKPTIVSDLVMRWALVNGKAKIRYYTHVYIASGEVDKVSHLERLLAQLGAIDFFCINDTTDDAQADDPRLGKIRTTLQLMFPTASCLENNGWIHDAPERLRSRAVFTSASRSLPKYMSSST
jgi:hypothetical protein